MPASILSAGTNRHDSVVQIARSAVWRPVRQIVLDHPVRDTLVAVAEQLAKRNPVHEQLERQPIVRSGTIRKAIHLTANVPDQRPGVPDPRLSTKASSPGSLHLARWVLSSVMGIVYQVSRIAGAWWLGRYTNPARR